MASGFCRERPRGVPAADAALLPLPPGEGRGEGGLQPLAVDGPLDDRILTGDRERVARAEHPQIAISGQAHGVTTDILPPPPPRRRGLVVLASAAAAAALLAGIVITIKNEKGRAVAKVETNGRPRSPASLPATQQRCLRPPTAKTLRPKT